MGLLAKETILYAGNASSSGVVLVETVRTVAKAAIIEKVVSSNAGSTGIVVVVAGETANTSRRSAVSIENHVNCRQALRAVGGINAGKTVRCASSAYSRAVDGSRSKVRLWTIIHA